MGDGSSSDAMRGSWEDVAHRKNLDRSKRIESFLQSHSTDAGRIDPELILDIDDVAGLTARYATGSLSVRQVVTAYARRAAKAHAQTNCLTEVLFDNAVDKAVELDEYFRQTGKLIGPLHGVPVTLKDQFDVKGVDSTIGYVGRAFNPAKDDAALVTILKGLGAVVLAKTNLPQSIMWCETNNPLWGLTVNPLNPDFTPGGSTGGEGALLAMQGSLLGWGTDIGGSVRIPSHMNGLWGLKPTSTRLPYQGVPVSTEGQSHVPSSVGPMARSLSTLTITMQNVLNAAPWVLDSNVTPLPWRDDIFRSVQSRPLVVALLTDDGVVKVHPPVQRLLLQLAEKLKLAGHEVVEWDPLGHKECIEVMDAFYSSDGCEDIQRDIKAGGEPVIPHVAKLIKRGPPISVYEYWQLNKRKIAAQQAYNRKWNDARSAKSGQIVDVILMPTMPHSAVPHEGCRWVGYTKVWNLLDYTALSFPAGTVDGEIDIKDTDSYQARNDLDAWNWDLYDTATMHGHPVGLQLVGRRFEEEKVLGIASVVQKILKNA